MTDPYWSLWGKLKSRLRRDQLVQDEAETLMEPGVNLLDEIAGELLDEHRVRRDALVLPTRKVPVEYDGTHLIIGSQRKRINSDAHAVNSLGSPLVQSLVPRRQLH